VASVLTLLFSTHHEHPVVRCFIYKQLMKLTSDQAMFYLFQFFQLLGTNVGTLLETFLLDYAKQSPLFSHNLIWHCKLEAKSNAEDDNYFEAHAARRATANAMIDKIMENFSGYEKNVFEELDRFLNSVTDISSAMKPSMEYDQKLITIERCVENIKVPALAYLPTNPSMQVVSIVKGSGRAMQSKAKCPFLLTFVCKPFEGIDKVIQRRKQTSVLFKVWTEVSERPTTSIEIRNFTTEFKSIQSSSSSIRTPLPTSNIVRKNSIGSGVHPLDKLPDEPAGDTAKRSKIRILDGADLPSNSKATQPGLKNFDEVSQCAFSKFSNAQTIPDTIIEESRPAPKNESWLMETIKQTEGFNKDHKLISCIFKTKDDIRQDFLTLQFITLFKQAIKIEKSSLNLTPYRVFSNRTGDVP
jgi:hypothetical protein